MSKLFTPYFLRGYRAFVLGGRIEPFHFLSEENKLEYRKGVEYAKKERKECLKISKDRKLLDYKMVKQFIAKGLTLKQMSRITSFTEASISHFIIRHKLKYTKKEQIKIDLKRAEQLLQEGLTVKETAYILKCSVSSLWRYIKNKKLNYTYIRK